MEDRIKRRTMILGSFHPRGKEVPYRKNRGDTTGVIEKFVWRQVNNNSNNIEILRTTKPKVRTLDSKSMYPK